MRVAIRVAFPAVILAALQLHATSTTLVGDDDYSGQLECGIETSNSPSCMQEDPGVHEEYPGSIGNNLDQQNMWLLQTGLRMEGLQVVTARKATHVIVPPQPKQANASNAQDTIRWLCTSSVLNRVGQGMSQIVDTSPTEDICDTTQLVQHVMPLRKKADHFTKSTSFYCVLIYLVGYTACVVYMLRTSVWSENMGKIEKTEMRRPEQESWKTGFFSWIWISWVTPWIGEWGTAAQPDMTKIRAANLGKMCGKDDESHYNGRRFMEIWKKDTKERGMQTLTIVWAVLHFSTWKRLIWTAFCCGMYEALMFVAPTITLNYTLRLMHDLQIKRQLFPDSITTDDMLRPTLMIIGFFTFLPIIMITFNSLTFLMNQRLSMQVTGAMAQAAYQKAQCLPAGNVELDLSRYPWVDERQPKKYSFLQVIQSDIHSSLVGVFISVMRLVIALPILITLFIMLTFWIKRATIHAVGTVFTFMFFFSLVVSMMVDRSREASNIQGERISRTQEILYGIRVVKSYAWEATWAKRLQTIRDKEVERIRAYYICTGCFYTMMFSYPRLLILFSICGYLWCYGEMDAVSIFTMMQLLASFNGAARMFIDNIPLVIGILPSLQRCDRFFKLPDAPTAMVSITQDTGVPLAWERPIGLKTPREILENGKPVREKPVRIKGSFNWLPGDEEPVLKNLDVVLQPGSLTAVVGEVGAGKSAFLQALLGELPPSSDCVANAIIDVPKTVAYHSQIPLIIEGTLKENVIYWRNADEDLYSASVEAACLQRDIEMLPGGDTVPIGARGIALSGGQKARVSLARVAYTTQAELYLLDDPFGAVDGPTGHYMCEHLLMGELLKNRTRVVVCQPEMERMKCFDQVLVISKGRIVAQGSPDAVASNAEFQKLQSSYIAEEGDADNAYGLQKTHVTKSEGQALREEEHEGRANWETIKYFFGMGKWWCLIGCCILFFAMVLLGLLGDICLAHWSTYLTQGSFAGKSKLVWWTTDYTLYSHINGFIFWFSCGVIVYLFCWYLGMKFSLNMSIGVYPKMIQALLYAPIDRFHDKTPVGRIMQRMSGDLGAIDFTMYIKVTATIGMVMWIVVPLGYIHFSVPLWFSAASIPFYWLVAIIVFRYWNVVVPLRYLSNVTSAKLNAYTTEVQYSNATVRAYQVQSQIAYCQSLALDDCVKSDFAAGCTRRWVCNRLLLLYGFFCTLVGLLGLWFPRTLSIGTTSLCLCNIMQIIMAIENYLDQLTAAQFEFISMNRVHEYTQLPQERPHELPMDEILIQKSWRSKGARVVISDLVAGYGDLKADVLKGLNFIVEPKVKMAIVGTTGCGKSTFMLCLLRIIEPRSGKIEIDGINTQDLGLHALRKTLGLVPQDPVLFSGTVKSNLDPFDEYSDENMWRALNAVQLGDTIRGIKADSIAKPKSENTSGGEDASKRNVPKGEHVTKVEVPMEVTSVEVPMETSEFSGLESPVKHEGENFSFGQRQLLCVARMILRQPTLLLLDECTSAVDPATQEMVQKAIHSEFTQSTIIAIAHRLETILDFDQVIVMEAGHVIEKGSVKELAISKGGLFAKALASKGLLSQAMAVDP